MQNAKYVKIRKHTQVLYQKVEHTNFYVNITKNIYIYRGFSIFRFSG